MDLTRVDSAQATEVSERLMREEDWNDEDENLAEAAARRILVDTLDNMDGELIVETLEGTQGISAEWIRTAIAATHEQYPDYLPWADTMTGTPVGTPRPGTASDEEPRAYLRLSQQRQLLEERTRAMAAFITENLATEDESTRIYAVAKAACGL